MTRLEPSLTVLNIQDNLYLLSHFFRAGPRDVVAGGGGGALIAEVLNRVGKATMGGGREYERGLPPLSLEGPGGLPLKVFKKYVSENAFRSILKPIFPYSITSSLSKVRHSNTLFFAINFSFPCHPLGALVRLCYFIVTLPWPTK